MLGQLWWLVPFVMLVGAASWTMWRTACWNAPKEPDYRLLSLHEQVRRQQLLLMLGEVDSYYEEVMEQLCRENQNLEGKP